MQGKLDSSHSRSTSLVRLFKRKVPGPQFVLLLDCQFDRRGCPADFHGLSRGLAVFAPRLQGVFTGRNVFDLEVAVLVGHRDVRSWNDDDIARHLRMYIAEQGCYTQVVELE